MDRGTNDMADKTPADTLQALESRLAALQDERAQALAADGDEGEVAAQVQDIDARLEVVEARRAEAADAVRGEALGDIEERAKPIRETVARCARARDEHLAEVERLLTEWWGERYAAKCLHPGRGAPWTDVHANDDLRHTAESERLESEKNQALSALAKLDAQRRELEGAVQ